MLGWIRAQMQRLLGSTTSRPGQWFLDWLHGSGTRESDSGIRLDGKTALRYAPVWYAVRRISGHVAQLPLVLYQRTGDRAKRRATEHPAYRLCKRAPNSLMTASVFRELLQYHALIWGNGRAVIIRNRRGDPIELVPLLPDRTKTVLVAGEKWHISEIVVDEATGQTESRKFRDADVLHIIGLGFDGITGYPLWELGKNSWGLGLAGEKYTNRFYRNNAVPGLLLEAPAGVFRDDEEAKKFLTAFREMQEGLDNASKTALLREGIKATKLSNTAAEAQQIETRQFQRQEVALWFLLEAITGDDKSVSYSSLEQKHIAYLVNCLNGWLVKWQEQCEEKLLREREKAADSHFFRFSTGALLRSDTKTTVTTLTMAVRGMLMTINEARDLLDLDEIEGGDDLLNPAITPGKASDAGGGSGQGNGGQENGGQGNEDPALQQRLRAVVRGRLQDLADVERRRVKDLAGDAERVAAWYERWEATLATALGQLLGERQNCELLAGQMATAWIAESQDGQREWEERIEALTTALVS